MDRLKSLFPMSYFIVVVVIIATGLYQLLAHGLDLAWLGATLTTGPVLVVFVRWMVRKVARTSQRLPVLATLTLAGLAIALYGYFTAETPRLLPLVAATIGTAGFLLYDFWYSSYGRKLNVLLALGNTLPVFEIEDQDGTAVSSASLMGQPALLMFFRGNWCPVCMAQVAEITGRYRELIERGVHVALISPQPHDLTRRVAEIYEVPFRFWVDRGNTAARALDIVNENGVPADQRKRYGSDTVLPTVIMTDAAGKIIFTDQTDNYRVRPDPEVFFRALSAHGL